MIILDTNVISEIMKPVPDARVRAWLDNQKPINLALSAITIAEIRYGIARLPFGKKRQMLESRFTSFVQQGFSGRVLAFDERAAQCYGELAASCRQKGDNVDTVDLMIAAIAIDNEASIATRNTMDFKSSGVKLINPWE